MITAFLLSAATLVENPKKGDRILLECTQSQYTPYYTYKDKKDNKDKRVIQAGSFKIEFLYSHKFKRNQYTSEVFEYELNDVWDPDALVFGDAKKIQRTGGNAHVLGLSALVSYHKDGSPSAVNLVGFYRTIDNKKADLSINLDWYDDHKTFYYLGLPNGDWIPGRSTLLGECSFTPLKKEQAK